MYLWSMEVYVYALRQDFSNSYSVSTVDQGHQDVGLSNESRSQSKI